MPRATPHKSRPRNAAEQDAIAPGSAAAEQAIAWMVKLQSGTARPGDVQAWQRWRAEHPDHQRAWARLEAVGRRVQSLPSALAHATLESSIERPRGIKRRTVLKSIAILLATGTLALAGREWPLWQQLVADYSTGIGERRTVLLADGSRVALNTDTAIDASFDAERRVLHLRRGEILVTTAPDPALQYRPFIVHTAHGRMRALGTRFLVHEQGDGTLVSVFEGGVEVRAQNSGMTIQVPAGRQVRFNQDAIDRMQAADPDRAAWTEGALVVKRMPLAVLCQELQRYRVGYLGCDERAGALAISGVFPLEDTDRILAALEQTLPVTVERHTRYWVTVRHR